MKATTAPSMISLGGYRIPITVRPIVAWPGPESEEERKAPFRASFSKTTAQFAREMYAAGASNVVLEMYVRERDIRNDGWIREDARPSKPGVVLSFVAERAGALRFPCDTFNNWQDNLRAIVLSLEALRAVDRYGVTKRSEQFAGWKALPATTVATLPAEAAALIVAEAAGRAYNSGKILENWLVAQRALRVARNNTHPDKNAGESARWDAVDEARRVLVAHHGKPL